MSEWNDAILSDFIEIKHGYAFKGAHITDQESDQILVTPGNFKIGGGFKSDKFKYYNGIVPEEYILQEGDIVVTMTDLSKESDTLGYSAKIPRINKKLLLHNQRIGVVKFIDENVCQDFIYWLLRTKEYQWFIVGSASGTSVMHTSPSRIGQYEFKLPDINAQESIAEILSCLDDKIDLLHRQNKTLELIAETLFRQWFVKNSNKNLKWGQLGDYVEVVRGLSYKGAGLSDEENGIPMHNLNSVFEGGGYKYEGIKFYSSDYRKQHLLNPGDLIITNTEQGHDMLLIGFPAIVPQHFGDIGIFSQHIFKLELKDDYLTVPFLYYLLMTFDMREQIAGSTNGSTVNMLPKDGIEWARFRVPPKSKIDEFTQLVQPILDKQETNFESIKNLEALRDTLLPKLMSGEVTISDE